MRLLHFLYAAILGVSLTALSACTTAPPGVQPLVYSQQYHSNVSTIVWPAAAARASEKDLTAPDFRWRDSSGALDSLSNHRGQTVLVNFWATWCNPCTGEMPDLQSVQKTMGDSLYIIGVSDDNSGNTFNTVQSFISQNKYSYQFALDSEFMLYEKYFPDFTDFAIPQSCFIDPAGNLVFTVTGAMGNDATVLTFARKAAAE
ncbi:MAG TPA: TlpA disulfide reductase family protein [Candidatus Kapabacteria bacterium]|jgi:peroxiredoxin